MSDDYGSRKKHSQVLDRRPLRYWQKFNDWWRGEFDKHNRRPTAEEIIMWYDNHADETWGNEKPTVQETRVHAKCLRSVESVRDYFRDYRAKKKGDKHSADDDDRPVPKRAKHSAPNSPPMHRQYKPRSRASSPPGRTSAFLSGPTAIPDYPPGGGGAMAVAMGLSLSAEEAAAFEQQLAMASGRPALANITNTAHGRAVGKGSKAGCDADALAQHSIPGLPQMDALGDASAEQVLLLQQLSCAQQQALLLAHLAQHQGMDPSVAPTDAAAAEALAAAHHAFSFAPHPSAGMMGSSMAAHVSSPASLFSGAGAAPMPLFQPSPAAGSRQSSRLRKQRAEGGGRRSGKTGRNDDDMPQQPHGTPERQSASPNFMSPHFGLGSPGCSGDFAMEMATEAARLVHWFASPRPVAANRSSGASLLGGDIDWLDGALGALPPTTTQKRRSTSGVPAADCELTAAKRYRTSAVLLGLETPVPGLGGLTPGAPLDLLDSDLPSFSAVKMLLGDTPCGRVAATPAGFTPGGWAPPAELMMQATPAMAQTAAASKAAPAPEAPTSALRRPSFTPNGAALVPQTGLNGLDSACQPSSSSRQPDSVLQNNKAAAACPASVPPRDTPALGGNTSALRSQATPPGTGLTPDTNNAAASPAWAPSTQQGALCDLTAPPRKSGAVAGLSPLGASPAVHSGEPLLGRDTAKLLPIEPLDCGVLGTQQAAQFNNSDAPCDL